MWFNAFLNGLPGWFVNTLTLVIGFLGGLLGHYYVKKWELKNNLLEKDYDLLSEFQEIISRFNLDKVVNIRDTVDGHEAVLSNQGNIADVYKYIPKLYSRFNKKISSKLKELEEECNCLEYYFIIDSDLFVDGCDKDPKYREYIKKIFSIGIEVITLIKKELK